MPIRYGLLAFFMGILPGVSAQNVDYLESSLDSLDQTTLDQVLISTKRLEPLNQEQASTLVIDQETIQTFSGGSLAKLLNQIGGIEINGATGHSGQNLGYYVRGGNNRQVLIMVDGAVVSDASSIASDFDLRLLPLDQIQSIAIVRGPSSVLYGSGAATAVIYIKTKQYNKQGIQLDLQQSFGTNRSTDQSPLSGIQRHHTANLSIGKGPWLLQLQGNTRFIDGLSAIAPEVQQREFDPDAFAQFNGRVQVKYVSENTWSMEQFFAFDRMRQDFDAFNYQDAPFQSDTQQWRIGGSFYFKGNKSRYEFHDQWSHTIRSINSDYPATYESLNYNADQFITTQWSEQLETVFGTQGGWSSMDLAQANGADTVLNTVLRHPESRTYFIDTYLNLVFWPMDSFSIDLGGRWHHHMRYGNQGVYQLSPRYSFSNPLGNFSIYGRYGTAFIAPSLYQLYDPTYGNQDLEPEFNTSTELGLIWQKNQVEGSIRWFDRFEEQAVNFSLLNPDLYVYQYTNNPENQRRWGFEIEGKLSLASWINTQLFYTWVKAQDFDLLRVPPHKFNGHINVAVNKEEQISLRWTWSDFRRDQYFDSVSFTSQNISLRPYHWIDLVYSAQLIQGLHTQLSITNLLNQEAQPLYRYSGQGRNVIFGLRWQSQNY